MLFSFAVRSVYMESCSMFVRGGVYVVVRDAMGPSSRSFSVSALIFDYVLTGPISVVSAGQYLGRLLNEIGEPAAFGILRGPRTIFAVFFSVAVTALFLVQQHQGHSRIQRQAPAHHADHHGDGGILLIWCPLTLADQRAGADSRRSPVPANLHFSHEWPGLA